MTRLSAARARVAVISFHTSPLDPPGVGDSGGMNVYIREVVERLGDRGIAVDVFTRCAGREVPEIEAIGTSGRVIQASAGPCAPVPKEQLPGLLPAFVHSLLSRDGDRPYDLVHAHYWLSGWVGRVAKSAWGVPLIASFHTLGRVKNLALGEGESPEPPGRLIGEQAIVRDADRILVPTRTEARSLIDLYRSSHERIRVVTPGVDTDAFRPLPRTEARSALGIDGPIAMFVGRLQAHKGPDVAIRAVAAAVRSGTPAARDLQLVMVGGPSGGGDRQLTELRRLARSEGIEERVRMLSPVPHDDLPAVYAAADVVLVPSRSESFGLVALEAQASGIPVIAASVGGLRHLVRHGTSGFLVSSHDPAAFARGIVRILSDPELARRLARGAVARAAAFPWERTADELVSVYEEVLAADEEVLAADALCLP